MLRNIPKLQTEHFQNCRFFGDREELLSIAPRGGVGAELGVFEGEFSETLLRTLQPRKLFLIDIAFAVDPAERFADSVRQGVVEIRRGDSSSELAKFPDGFFDWVYVDGDHSYEGVAKDAKVARRKVKPEGCLIFNDYKMGDHNHPDGFYEYGVIHAVNNLCLHDGWELVGFAFHFQMYCDVMLRKRP